jgi:hypothetical protein
MADMIRAGKNPAISNQIDKQAGPNKDPLEVPDLTFD